MKILSSTVLGPLCGIVRTEVLKNKLQEKFSSGSKYSKRKKKVVIVTRPLNALNVSEHDPPPSVLFFFGGGGSWRGMEERKKR